MNVQLEFPFDRPALTVVPATERPKRRRKPAARPEPAQVNLIAFPLAAHENVLVVAAKLRAIRDEDKRLNVFRQHLQAVRNMRLRAGLPPEVVKADVDDYATAIRRAFWSPAGVPSGRSPRRQGA